MLTLEQFEYFKKHIPHHSSIRNFTFCVIHYGIALTTEHITNFFLKNVSFGIPTYHNGIRRFVNLSYKDYLIGYTTNDS